jgi:3-isopropylmalate/(R)-2-methylmalate dehydratase small subunit
MSALTGQAWVFGADVNTDVMAPGLYFKAPIAEMARHCMEAIDPGFAAHVQPGDIVVAGKNFGVGSAREQAPKA